MFRVHYFASLREKLGSAGESLEAADDINTVADLIAVLTRRGGAWNLLADSREVLVAVDQAVADRDQTLNGDEEVAFFPPMTGG
ncbi:MAG: molybdopterin converting factor subunit 1 [Pseudohongiella sp.]|uniref:molybdopterin converting factor subunit 1 n=1 Tax=Pseudohongiella sp. TaxID=1979412 RepID=UPI0034A01397